MFYLYTILVPLTILSIGYYSSKTKLRGFRSFVSFMSKHLVYLFLYGLFMYYLEMENYIDEGWVFYSLMFFLIPISIIILLCRLFFWFTKE